MKNNFVKGLLAFLAVLASFTAVIAIMMKVFKKFFTISVEFSPKYENEECECEDCCEEAESEDDGIEFELCEDEEAANA